MQINGDLLNKVKAAVGKNSSSYLEKILLASTEHGNFGMELLDRLRNQLPATKCGNCGQCCNSVSIYSLEYHRIVRDLMTRCSPERLHRFFVSAMRPDLRQAEIGNEKRLRCVFRDEESKVCLIHPVRPFACRIFGLLKEDGKRECDQVEDLNFPARTVGEKEIAELQAKILENSESYQVFANSEKIHFFPFEFWVFRHVFSAQRALQIYREVLIGMSTPLSELWQQDIKLDPIKDINYET